MAEYEDTPIEFVGSDSLPAGLPLMVGHTELVGKVVSCEPLEISYTSGSRKVEIKAAVRVLPLKGKRDRVLDVIRSLPGFTRMRD